MTNSISLSMMMLAIFETLLSWSTMQLFFICVSLISDIVKYEWLISNFLFLCPQNPEKKNKNTKEYCMISLHPNNFLFSFPVIFPSFIMSWVVCFLMYTEIYLDVFFFLLLKFYLMNNIALVSRYFHIPSAFYHTLVHLLL